MHMNHPPGIINDQNLVECKFIVNQKRENFRVEIRHRELNQTFASARLLQENKHSKFQLALTNNLLPIIPDLKAIPLQSNLQISVNMQQIQSNFQNIEKKSLLLTQNQSFQNSFNDNKENFQNIQVFKNGRYFQIVDAIKSMYENQNINFLATFQNQENLISLLNFVLLDEENLFTLVYHFNLIKHLITLLEQVPAVNFEIMQLLAATALKVDFCSHFQKEFFSLLDILKTLLPDQNSKKIEKSFHIEVIRFLKNFTDYSDEQKYFDNPLETGKGCMLKFHRPEKTRKLNFGSFCKSFSCNFINPTLQLLNTILNLLSSLTTESIMMTVDILNNIYSGLEEKEASEFLADNLSLMIDIMDFLKIPNDSKQIINCQSQINHFLEAIFESFEGVVNRLHEIGFFQYVIINLKSQLPSCIDVALNCLYISVKNFQIAKEIITIELFDDLSKIINNSTKTNENTRVLRILNLLIECHSPELFPIDFVLIYLRIGGAGVLENILNPNNFHLNTTVEIALEFIENILNNQQFYDSYAFQKILEEKNIFTMIQILQNHHDFEIYQKSYQILDSILISQNQ